MSLFGILVSWLFLKHVYMCGVYVCVSMHVKMCVGTHILQVYIHVHMCVKTEVDISVFI